MIETACQQGAAWRQAGHEITVAVNVSARQLDSDELIGDIEGSLARSGLEPAALTIEITETTLMRNAEQTGAPARDDQAARRDDRDRRLRHGLLIARTPAALPCGRAEDRPLVHLRPKQNTEGETLIRTLVQLGKALSLDTFAEGIEQHEELSLLRSESCDSGQGFLYARPLDATATEEFLDNRAGSPAPAGAAAPARR